MDMIRAEGRHLAWRDESVHKSQEIIESTHEIVAMIVAVLGPHADLYLVVAGVPSRLEEVLWQELTVCVEVVPGALRPRS